MFSFLHNQTVSCENKPANSEKCGADRCFGSQLVRAAFSGFNTFIYKLAFDGGIARNFTVKYSSAAPACSMFNVLLL